jgi:hypothetical protein
MAIAWEAINGDDWRVLSTHHINTLMQMADVNQELRKCSQLSLSR